jgi:putative NADH-flavin reductase
MKLLVLGASGKTGSEVVRQALDAGHEVTAFVRDRAKLSITDAGLRVSIGDAMSFDDLRSALKGQDAVISTLGASKSSEKLIAPSTEALIKAMRETGVKRVVMMSSFLSSPSYKPGGLSKLLGFATKGMVTDKQAGEARLRQSDLDWTIVYAARLKNGEKTGNYRIVAQGERFGMSNSITRADVADRLLRAGTSNESAHQSLVITANGANKG